MSIPEKKPEPLSLEDEIRALLAEGRISDAKRLVDGAGDSLPAGSRLREIFYPTITKLDMRDVDRTGEYRWLKENGRSYRGKWVAVAGENLVLATDSLKELLASLEEIDTPVQPLIHHIGPAGTAGTCPADSDRR